MSNEQEILDNATEGATHYAQGLHYIAMNTAGNWMRYDTNGLNNSKWFPANDYKFLYVKDFRSLADITRIAELEKERNETSRKLLRIATNTVKQNRKSWKDSK